MKKKLFLQTLLFCYVIALPMLAQATTISMFYDPGYVDTSTEGPNLRATIESLGHTVNTFTGITDADLSAAIAGGDLLVFPEMERSDLASALSASAIGVLESYVLGGGAIIQANTFFSNESLPNTLFGWSLVSGGGGGPSTLIAAYAAGTAFAAGPATLPGLDAVQGISMFSLPGGALNLYLASGSTSTTVFAATYGAGDYVFLGYDWFAGLDASWTTVTGLAIDHVVATSVPEPATMLLLSLGFLGIAGLGRKKILTK